MVCAGSPTNPCNGGIWSLSDVTYPGTWTFRIKTTISANSVWHVSPVISVTVTCTSGYSITESTPTNPQYVSHGKPVWFGFILPVYTTSQNAGCPITIRTLTQSATSIVPVGGLNAANYYAPNYVVSPSDSSLHLSYQFYVSAQTVNSLSSQIFGPYTLNIGCTTTVVSFIQDPAFTAIKDVSLYVGDSTVEVFTFIVPKPQPVERSWCVPYKNTLVNDDASGTTLSGAVAGKMI
jgi:hypothetical protein